MKRLLLFLLTASLLLTSMTGCLLGAPQSNETTPEPGTPFGTTPSLPEDLTTPPPEETTPDGSVECPYKWLDAALRGHYKFALCTCCEYPRTIEPHVDADEDYFCDICGYEEPHPYYLAEKETWLNEISADDIVEIYGIQSGMGTKTYGMERFITITDKAQIAEILEMARTIHITPVPPNTAGYEPTDESRYIQFTLADGTVYYIHQMGCEIYAQSPSSSRNWYEGMRLENIPLLDEYENSSVFYY